MDLFAPARPAEGSGAAAALRAHLARLSEADRAFAQSLLSCRRPLSGKQSEWVERLAQRATAPTDATPAVEGLGPIVALLDTAARTLKWPVLRCAAGSLPLRLGRAGPGARELGAVNVTSASALRASRVYYGRISRAGRFEPNPARPEEAAAIGAGLVAFAAAPVEQARIYGQRFGNCCFCGLELTDARSVAAGYGPICADNWSLPWGG